MKEWGQLPLRGQETSSWQMTAEQEEPFSDIQHLRFFHSWTLRVCSLEPNDLATVPFLVAFSLLVKTDKCHDQANMDVS